MADEINRARPRTQSALLQAMQEHEVTIAGQHRPLGRPFHVLATQNPIEQEGTYPLPEAQLDRFLVQVDVDYPDRATERDILIATTGRRGGAGAPGVHRRGTDRGAGACSAGCRWASRWSRRSSTWCAPAARASRRARRWPMC